MLMDEFKPTSTGVGSDRSAIWATTNAQARRLVYLNLQLLKVVANVITFSRQRELISFRP